MDWRGGEGSLGHDSTRLTDAQRAACLPCDSFLSAQTSSDWPQDVNVSAIAQTRPAHWQ